MLWYSNNFSVNASNRTEAMLDASGLGLVTGGYFELHYQKRVIDAALWVNEPVNDSLVKVGSDDPGWLVPAPSVLLVVISFALAAINGRNSRLELYFTLLENKMASKLSVLRAILCISLPNRRVRRNYGMEQ